MKGDDMRKIVLLAFLLQIFLVTNSYALNGETHSNINESIARHEMNGFLLNLYLKTHVAFGKGIEEKVGSHEVWEWIADGGKREDEPYGKLLTGIPFRTLNHFHNPLTDQGLTGGESAVAWSQEDLGAQSQGNYAWRDVRKYFNDALTTKDTDDREENLAEMFRGLGQLMHLVQDMSVPEHARNDVHVWPSGYETWAKGITNKNPNVVFDSESGAIIIGDNTTFPFQYDQSLLTTPSKFTDVATGKPLVPISNLFDNGRYRMPNPDPAVTLQRNVGLSEYTCANFFSPDTFKDNVTFPNPAWADLEGYLVTVPNSSDKQILYFRKNAGAPGEHIQHLARAKKFFNRLPDEIKSEAMKLDDTCYSDYAKELMPRAVGYASGILKYFFRGTLEISMPDRFVYSIADGGQNPQQFTYMKAKVKNTSKIGDITEEMTGGQDAKLWAIAKYRKRTNYDPNLANDPPTAAAREANFFYSVSAPYEVPNGISATTPTEFNFNFSGNPIPAGITDLYLQVVYQGTLGNEENTAVAVGMKDLSEPTHFSYFNGTDQVYFWSGIACDDFSCNTFRTAQQMEQIKRANTWSLIPPYTAPNYDYENPQYVDDFCHPVPWDGTLLFIECAGLCAYPFDEKVLISFYPSGGAPLETPHVIYRNLPGGRYGRMILLCDINSPVLSAKVDFESADVDNFPWIKSENNAENRPCYYNESFYKGYFTPTISLAKHQDNAAGVFEPGWELDSFRNVQQHSSEFHSNWKFYYNKKWEAGFSLKSAPWPSMANPLPVEIGVDNPDNFHP